MSLDDKLDRVRDELADEVASDVRVPSFDAVLARRVHRRRLQATAGGAALVVVVAGVVGGVAATRPDASRSVPPAATLSVGRPTALTSPPVSASPTMSATTAPTSAQTYPAKGSSYVVVPDGDQLAWTDLKTGAHGHFGPADGGQLSDPSVSADGRRVAYAQQTPTGTAIAVWNRDTRQASTVLGPGQLSAPSISPDGTRVIFSRATVGVEVGLVGAPASSVPPPIVVVPNAVPATWDGNDALAYLSPSGDCAVERVAAIASAVRKTGTRCLLPTATLQSVFAPDGSTWQLDSISGSVDGRALALGVTTAHPGYGPAHGGIGLLRSGAEATPFRVLPSTIVQDTRAKLLGIPVLIDRGAGLLYDELVGPGAPGARISVVSLDVATGRKTTIAAGAKPTLVDGAVGGGLGANSA